MPIKDYGRRRQEKLPFMFIHFRVRPPIALTSTCNRQERTWTDVVCQAFKTQMNHTGGHSAPPSTAGPGLVHLRALWHPAQVPQSGRSLGSDCGNASDQGELPVSLTLSRLSGRKKPCLKKQTNKQQNPKTDTLGPTHRILCAIIVNLWYIVCTQQMMRELIFKRVSSSLSLSLSFIYLSVCLSSSSSSSSIISINRAA